MKKGKHSITTCKTKKKKSNVQISEIRFNNRFVTKTKLEEKERIEAKSRVVTKTVKDIRILLIAIVMLIIMFNMKNLIAYFTDFTSRINAIIINAKYNVTFDSNTGTGTMQPQEISYNIPTNLTANTFTKNGYNFTGWNTDPTGNGTSYTNEQSVTNLNDIILYAQWEMATYNISYILNDGTVATNNPTTYTMQTATFTLDNPTKTGYTFKGWSGTELTGDTNTTVTVTQGSTGDREYTANWTANTYYIHFNSNGGTGSMPNQTMTYDTSANIDLNGYTRAGYKFIGWNTEVNGSGTSYENQESITNLTATNGFVINLYAQWELLPSKYAVQIYGINQDVGEDGTTPLGLTFGPATGANYNNSYVTHEYEETYTGSGVYNVKIVTHTVAEDGTDSNTSYTYLTNSNGENVTRTTTQVNERRNIILHDMTWTEIAAEVDKTKFIDCMLCGDTKSVSLTLNNTISNGNLSNQYGDGAGALYNKINNTTGAYYINWNPSTNRSAAAIEGGSDGSNAGNAGGYSTSHIRATLIGVNDKTNEAYAGDINLTEDTSLYSCIEDELRNLITAKQIKYVTGTSTNNYSLNNDIADKIWLFSQRELYGTGTYSGLETEGLGAAGTGYERFTNTESRYYIGSSPSNSETGARSVYHEGGVSVDWWLRSPSFYNSTYVYYGNHRRSY